jgi:hypothetical protein
MTAGLPGAGLASPLGAVEPEQAGNASAASNAEVELIR